MAQITIGSNQYDSFISVADADIYLGGDISRATGWALRNTENRGRALISATRMLFAMPYCGEKPEYDAPPNPLPDVTAMLAADLAAKPKLFANATGDSNIKTVKAGSAQVEFFSPVAGGPPIPRALWDMLVSSGLVCLGTEIAGMVGGFYASGSDCQRPLGGRFPWDWPIASEDYD